MVDPLVCASLCGTAVGLEDTLKNEDEALLCVGARVAAPPEGRLGGSLSLSSWSRSLPLSLSFSRLIPNDSLLAFFIIDCRLGVTGEVSAETDEVICW